MYQHLNKSDLADVLRFYGEAGLDFALEDTAQNRLVAAPKVDGPLPPVLMAPKMQARPAMAGASVAVPDEAAVAKARDCANLATSLDELRASLEAFDGCSLKFTAKNLVFADGNSDAKIMLIGEAPGREEDLEGRPFAGQAGILLDKMLHAIGLDRSKVYMANVIYWRPPGNRTPTPMETEICRPFIERQIELVNPDVVVLVGGVSAKSLLPTSEGILRLRGVWQQLEMPSRRVVPALPILHPDYLLRQVAQKKLAWRDLLSLKAKIKELNIL